MLIIVDGYNLLRTMYSDGLSEDRDEMLRLLERYRKTAGNKVLVVFDGYLTGRLADSEEKFGGIRIIYTGQNKKADERIKKIIRETGGGCVVVSSDRAIAQFADGAGAGDISSDAFLERLYLASFKDSGECDNDEASGEIKKGNPKRQSKKERKRQGMLKKI